MRNNIIIVLMLLGLTFLGTSVVLADLNDGLVAYYPFNGNANDESENGNNGAIYQATLTEGRFGTQNSALSFNGTNSYVEINDSPSLSFKSNFCISVWFNNFRSNTRGRLLTKGPDNDRDFHIFWESDNGIEANIRDSQGEVPSLRSDPLSTNTWYNLVFVVSGGNFIKIVHKRCSRSPTGYIYIPF